MIPFHPVERLFSRFFVLAALVLALGLAAGCDTGFSGSPDADRLPDTDLSVRSQSLVGQVDDADRFTSNITLAWSGTDPDGFVVAYELRYFAEGQTPAAETGWTRTTRRDTTLLLPIERGQKTANVVVEVRSIDNEGNKDATPARTVFPIRNSPPNLAFDRSELPADTTWTVASFAFSPTDPEGESNLARLDVALNDSTTFVSLPAETRFVTLVAETSRSNTATTVSARVYLGRTFQRTDILVPGMRMNARNVLYARVADQTDTTSAVVRYPAAGATKPWFVKKPKSRVLVVNDYRRITNGPVLAFHKALVQQYTGAAPDVWNIETPYVTGSTGTSLRSPLLGASQEPFLRETFALWERIYWVATATTNSGLRNNLPYAAPTMTKFFDAGGRMMVQSPVTVPGSSAELEENLDNPALFLLPISSLVTVPDSVRSITMATGSAVTPSGTLPGAGTTPPALRANQFVITTLPYQANDSRTIPVYTGAFQYQTRVGNRRGPWPGPSVVASLRLDATGAPTVGVFSLPLVDDTGTPVLVGADGTTEAPREAVRQMLRALGF